MKGSSPIQNISMVPYMRAREPGLSAKKPYFKDRRSAVISIAVVAFLLILAVLGIDNNNVRRLSGYQKQASLSRATVESQISERFRYAATLASLLEERDSLQRVLSAFENADTVERQSELYRELEKELAVLQKELYADPAYNLYSPYFEKMYEIERQLIESIADYNLQADFFNRQIKAFPANLVAKRLALVELSSYAVSSALKSRP
ncbi:hypothetical protein DYP60_05910 [Sphaerochaeta halotolerans]|uniref:LemA family protein n=2 Tax=Sphaerochaeta halotolerans TaxID=2293840 RepID=A0A372MHA4_9SPIR|nr:hypothetical protein DYP60_05910 [Sphaerochaeta halotolerans]